MEIKSDKAFYLEACRFADSKSASTAAKWWAAFNEVIIRHLFYEGEINTPLFGKFKIKRIKESKQVQKDAEGKSVLYTIPAHDIPAFIPSDNFINDVNMSGITKAYRKRRRKDCLTERDYLRELRAGALGITDVGSKEIKQEAQAAFQQKLGQIIAAHKGLATDLEDEEDE